MNVLVFNIETVPDTEAGRRLYGNPVEMAQFSDEDVVRVMALQRRRQTDGQTDKLPLYLQRVVAISVVMRAGEQFKVWSAGTPESPEAALIQGFFDEVHTSTLVSWNGSGFNLPVLHYRAMLHGISAPRYWNHHHHIDLMEVLAASQAHAYVPLDEMAALLGFPAKPAGANVWETWPAGGIQAIRDDCEINVLNTYRIYLRFELMRGNLTPESYATECEMVQKRL